MNFKALKILTSTFTFKLKYISQPLLQPLHSSESGASLFLLSFQMKILQFSDLTLFPVWEIPHTAVICKTATVKPYTKMQLNIPIILSLHDKFIYLFILILLLKGFVWGIA